MISGLSSDYNMDYFHTRTHSTTQKRLKLLRKNSYLNKDPKRPTLLTSEMELPRKNGSVVFESTNSIFSPKKLLPPKRFVTQLKKNNVSVAAKRIRHSRSGIAPALKLPQLETKFPVTPSAAIKLFNRELTDIETQEISEYQAIYYLGLCNEPRKFEGKNCGYDDNKGFYKLYVGDHLDFRYEILNLLGKGTFGYVCKCYDHKRKVEVAAKVIKNQKEYHAQALVEINLLEELNAQDPDDSAHVVRVKSYFFFRSHVVIVFELLEMSLFHYLRVHRVVAIEQIVSFTKQMLIALKLMSKSKIIHCDIKPDNILFKTNKSNSLKVIDFGLGCFSNEKVHSYIQSRFYRAPEITLEIPYTTAIDMWSVGCVLGELITGAPLFPCASEEDLIHSIEEMLGPPPKEVVYNSKKKHFFTTAGAREGKLERHLSCEDAALVDLVKKCLDWNPLTRITPSQALKHQCIVGQLKSPKARVLCSRRSIS